ncbi:MAG: hypothetical protein ACFFCQ_17725 [Promethearchaeota archaeon]
MIDYSIKKNQQKLYNQIRKSHYLLITQIASEISLLLYLIIFFYILYEYIVLILLLLLPFNIWSSRTYFRHFTSSFREFQNIERVSDESSALIGLITYINSTLNLLRPFGSLSADPPEDTQEKLHLMRKRISSYTFGQFVETIAILIVILLTFSFWSYQLRVDKTLTFVLSSVLLIILLFKIFSFYNWQKITKRWILSIQDINKWGKELEKSFSNHFDQAD